MNKTNNKASFVKRSPLVAVAEYAKLLIQLKERFLKSQVKDAVKVNTTGINGFSKHIVFI